MAKKYHGSCLCNGVQYEITKIQPKMGHCHCTMCRKFHGAAYASFAEVRPEDFRWLKGEDLLTSYQAENGTVRQFCKSCGSSLTFAGDYSSLDVALGTLDDAIDVFPDAHIYVDFKANWSKICGDLPQYPEDRDS